MKVQLNLKIEEKDLLLIRKIASRRGGSHADFVRMAIRKELARLGFLSVQDMKALEVTHLEK